MGEYWKEAHKNSYFHAPGVSPTFQVLFSSLDQSSNRRCIEIGAGSGRHLVYVQNRLHNHGDYAAIDIVTDNLNGLIQKGIEVIQSDMRDCPVQSGLTGLAISWRVLHQLEDTGRTDAIDELRRITRSNANVLLAVRSTRDFWFGRGVETEKNSFVIDFPSQMPNGMQFISALGVKPWHFFSSGELYGLLESHGFDSIKLSPFVEKAESAGSLNNLHNAYWALSARRTGDAHQWVGAQLSVNPLE